MIFSQQETLLGPIERWTVRTKRRAYSFLVKRMAVSYRSEPDAKPSPVELLEDYGEIITYSERKRREAEAAAVEVAISKPTTKHRTFSAEDFPAMRGLYQLVELTDTTHGVGALRRWRVRARCTGSVCAAAGETREVTFRPHEWCSPIAANRANTACQLCTNARKRLDLRPGDRYGMLTIIGLVPDTNARNNRVFMCRCDCGKVRTAIASNIARGKTRSCGCLLKIAQLASYAERRARAPRRRVRSKHDSRGRRAVSASEKLAHDLIAKSSPKEIIPFYVRGRA